MRHPSCTPREDVGNHDGTASVAQRDDVASNLVAQELSGAQDVFGLLEGDGVERDECSIDAVSEVGEGKLRHHVRLI